MDKRTQIQEYFSPKPKFSKIWILIALVLIAIGGSMESTFPSFVGLLVGVVPFIIHNKAKKKFAGRASDSQIDTWLEEGFEGIKPKGLKKLGFENEDVLGEEIVISGPILWYAKGVPSEEIMYTVGNDGEARFSIYDVSIFYITEKGIGIYRSIYNFAKDVTLNDRTDEYFYKNITRVGTKEVSTNHTLPDNTKLISSEIFNLDIAGNSEIEIVLTDPAIEKFTGGTIPTSRAEKAVQTIKKLVRERN